MKNCIFTILLSVCVLLYGCRHKTEPTQDPELENMIKQVQNELQAGEHQGEGALICKVRSTDGLLFDARTELHFTGKGRGGYSRGGFRPGSCSEKDILVYYDRLHGQPAELRIIGDNYHEFRRSFVFEKGQVIIWDDVILERVDEKSACTIKGVIYLEDHADAGGIRVHCRDKSVTTNEKGEFVLLDMPSGENSVGARKTGYHGLYTRIQVERGQTVNCEINGYRIRKAKVRWAYQPDGSRNFSGENVLTGTATLVDGELDRVSFGEGFRQVNRHSDFLIYQQGTRLSILNFDVSSSDGPGIQEIKEFDFDTLTEAPLTEYKRGTEVLTEGAIFVFRTYDGEHYAKMEVLEILDSIDMN